MPVQPVGTQRDPRYTIFRPGAARVEFHYPNPGGRLLCQRLLDISAVGISFRLDDELPLIVRGAELSGVVLRIGDCAIEGKCVVKHVSNGTECIVGGLFLPASNDDALKLHGLIAGIAAQHR